MRMCKKICVRITIPVKLTSRWIMLCDAFITSRGEHLDDCHVKPNFLKLSHNCRYGNVIKKLRHHFRLTKCVFW